MERGSGVGWRGLGAGGEASGRAAEVTRNAVSGRAAEVNRYTCERHKIDPAGWSGGVVWDGGWVWGWGGVGCMD